MIGISNFIPHTVKNIRMYKYTCFLVKYLHLFSRRFFTVHNPNGIINMQLRPVLNCRTFEKIDIVRVIRNNII